jgi:hypothetical protein
VATAAAIERRSLARPRVIADERARGRHGRGRRLTFEAVEARWPALAASLAAGDGPVDWPGGSATRSCWPRGGGARRPRARRAPAVVVTHGARRAARPSGRVAAVDGPWPWARRGSSSCRSRPPPFPRPRSARPVAGAAQRAWAVGGIRGAAAARHDR